MKSKVRTMLEGLYSAFSQHSEDSITAWDNMIDFLAVDRCIQILLQIKHKFEWLSEGSGLVKKVNDIYDSDLLKSDYYDHLGDIYIENVLTPARARQRGISLLPVDLADKTAEITLANCSKTPKIIDPEVNTGRLLMACYKQAPGGRFYGVDTDLRLLRIAFTNLAIHDIHGYLLHADSVRHETDITTVNGKHNWQYANKWYSQMHNLKPRLRCSPKSHSPN